MNSSFGGETLTGTEAAHPFWEILIFMGDDGTAEDTVEWLTDHVHNLNKIPSG